MLGFLKILNPIEAITKGLTEAYIARQHAETDEARLEAEERIATLQAQKELAIVATKHDKWYTPRRWVEAAVAIYIIKIIVWDTVLGWGVTPNPGEYVTGIVYLVSSFWFGGLIANRATDMLALALMKRRK